MRSVVLLLALLLFASPARAVSPVLRPLPLSPACQKAGFTALQDAAGTLRVLRYVRTVPDNTARQTQYYGADGRLQSVRATASGFVGLLFDLTARVNPQGEPVGETGYRSKWFKGTLKAVLKDAALVKAGRCSPE